MGQIQTTASIKRGLILFTLSLCLGSAWAESSLLQRSPFLPQESNRPAETTPPPASTQQSQIQFKGVFALNDEVRFNLFDSSENKGSWIRMNDTFSGAKVIDFDESSRSIDVEIDGSITRFSLIEGSDKPLTVAPNIVGPRRPTITDNNSPRRAVSRRRIVPPSR